MHSYPLQHAARSTQHAARSTQHAARSTQHAARSTQHAARSTQHAARSLKAPRHLVSQLLRVQQLLHRQAAAVPRITITVDAVLTQRGSAQHQACPATVHLSQVVCRGRARVVLRGRKHQRMACQRKDSQEMAQRGLGTASCTQQQENKDDTSFMA
jgi:hypothetical protein